VIYRVLMDGQDIFNPQERQYALIDPHLSLELNTAGSFEFTMHPSHPFYGDVNPFCSMIEVYEDEVLLWFGRPVEITTDFYNQKKVYCEGAFAFFNDSVQRVHEYNSISVHEFFRTVIANHNEQVDAYKQFVVGEITVEDKTVYRKLNYKSTFETLKSQCLNAEGGYFFFRRENGANYIDWFADMPYTTNQAVEFGSNMLNASSQFDMTDFCTMVLPLGDEVDGARLTVASVNDGSDIIESEAVSEYGRIVKCVEFSGVTHADTLYEDGVEYLQNKQFDNLTIECTAADLHWQNENAILFRPGQKVRAHSVPHLIDKMFDLLKLDVSLDTTAKQITLGTYRRPTLTEITRDAGSSADLSEIEDQLSDITTTIDDITTVPDVDDIKDDVRETLDDIDSILDDTDFQDHLQDLLDDDELDDWLRDHGIDDPDEATVETVIDLIGDDLYDITGGLDDTTNYDDLSSINDDLSDYWSGNQDIFDYDSGGSSSSYSEIGDKISGTGSTISGATDTGSLADVKADLKDLTKRVDSLRDYNELMVKWEKDIEKRLTDAEELLDAVAKDAWVHEIDGQRVEVGIVNFVTTV